MTEREAFIEAIAAQPDEDTPRLVFADWLEENGEDDRAAFVRQACEIAARRRKWGNTPGPMPDDREEPWHQAHDLFEARRGQWLGPFCRLLGCEETPPVERAPGWAGRLWGRVAGEPRAAEHHVNYFGGHEACVQIHGNAPVRQIDLRRGLAEHLQIDFGSPFPLRDLDAALRLEPVHSLAFEFGSNPKLWRSIDVAGLSRIASLNLQLPAYSRRNAAAFAELAFGGNWSGLRDLHVWCPVEGGLVLPHGYTHQLANTPLLSGLKGLHATVAATDLALLTGSPHARNLCQFRAWGSHLPPDAADAISDASFQPNLEDLDLSLNHLGDAGARRLAAVAWPKLRRLDLGANGVTDAGVRHLLPLVPQLTELSLASGQITDAGARLLADAIDAEQLETLCLSYNPLSEEVVAELGGKFGSRFQFLTYDDNTYDDVEY